MIHPDDEARLEQSKMSFGEHLNELRVALFKSITALFLGFVVGLLIGNDVARYIQTPLVKALREFYLVRAERHQREQVAELRARGQEAPPGFFSTKEELDREGLMPQEFLVSPDDLVPLLKDAFPDAKFDETPATAAVAAVAAPASDAAETPGAATDPPKPTVKLDRDKLLPLRIYLPIEDDPRLKVVALNSQEPFMTYIHTSFIVGLAIASPFIFYFIWQFVAAGLYRQEQSYVYTYLPMSLALFVAGAFLAFYFAFEPLLNFLLWYYDRMDIEPTLRLSEWISLVLLLPLGFGVSFQLPLVMLMLERIGIFTVDAYWRKWRAAVIVIAFVAMLLTPSPDPYSMLLMGLPLVALYFGGIWMCKHMPGAKRRRAALAATT
jgi:sec-independent protein translocase protein TatC